MGLNLLCSSSSYDRKSEVVCIETKLPNPDPRNFKIVRSFSVDRNVILWVTYPDCTNYEGNKILFFHNCFVIEIENQKILDPHFSENPDYISPFARFEPTEAGWHAAIKLACYI